jgi:NitT/TauT family transport system ATP-binding protein
MNATLTQTEARAPLLKLRDIALSYGGGSLVIDGLDLNIGAGEIVSIVGPSGCGKSSLLRLIAELRAPNTGTIETHYTDPDRHGCSMVFQEDTLLPWLRVRDNVLLYHRFRGTRRSAEAKQDVARLLQMVGLTDSARMYPSQLSGGMRRRVAVLTALCAMPQLLLLDEPFSALDEPTRVDIHCDLYALVRTFGSTVVLVTHDLAEAISLSDRVVLLSRAPARVVEDHHMPFGSGRDIRNIRTDHRFLEIYAGLWDSMERQTARTRPPL